MAIMRTKYEATKKNDDPLCPNPVNLEDLFCVKEIDSNGIFMLNNGRFSKMFLLSDINFNGLTNLEQENIIENLSRILDSMTCRFSFTVSNEHKKDDDILSNLLYEMQDDELDIFRKGMNEFITDRISSARQGLHKFIYLTLTVESDSFFNANVMFSSLESTLRTAFVHIGVNEMSGASLVPLSTNERMQKLFDFSHYGVVDSDYSFDFYSEVDIKHDWKSTISPVSFSYHNNYFMLNGCYGAVYYVEEDGWPKELRSDFISAISEINCTSYVSVNSELLDSTTLKKEINRKHSKVGLKIEKEKKSNRNKNDFLSDASDYLLNTQESLNDFMRQLASNDNRYFNTTILIMFLADDYNDFIRIGKEMESVANLRGFSIRPCFTKQVEGLNSAFMFGAQEFKRVCNLSSICQAMLIPFKSQEIYDKYGRFMGLNQITQNPIVGDRKGLDNKAGLYLGMSRHGKSVFAKLEQICVRISKCSDQSIIIDPMGEYKPIIDALGGSIVSFSDLNDLFVNPLDINFENVDYSTLQEMISEKFDFILTLLSSCMRRDLNPEEQGVLDRVVDKMYNDNYSLRSKHFNSKNSDEYDFNTPAYLKGKDMKVPLNLDMSNEEQVRRYSPVLLDVYQRLMDYDGENKAVAKNLANNMDVFVNGSLNLFNHFTNVDLNKKLICFDLSEIKVNLKHSAMLIMIEIVRSKIKENWHRNIWTHLTIDEFHELLGVDKVCDYVIKLWKEVGKQMCILTGITQNMTDLLNSSSNSDKIKAIIGNTSYFALLKQSTLDKNMLMENMPSVSPAMFNFVEGALPGTGLLVFNNNTVPFDARISKDSLIYKLINTDGKIVDKDKLLEGA